MTLGSRLRTSITAVALGATGLLGLAACAPAGTAGVSALSPEQSALTAVGFAPADVVAAAAPSPAPGATGAGGLAGHPRLRALLIRRALGGHVLHGEVVISTKNGDVTVDVERGVITQISATSITVQASDGFVLTWAIGSPIHVIENRTSVQPSQLAAGDTVGVAGTKAGDTVTAKLIVVPVQHSGSGS